MPGKRSTEPTEGDTTEETKRFVAMVKLMMDEAMVGTGKPANQSVIARLVGVHPSYINKLLLLDRGKSGRGRGGIGAEIVRKVMETAHVDPWYFYDPGLTMADLHTGRRSYHDYPLGNARAKRLAAELAPEVARLLRDQEHDGRHTTTSVRERGKR